MRPAHRGTSQAAWRNRVLTASADYVPAASVGIRRPGSGAAVQVALRARRQTGITNRVGLGHRRSSSNLSYGWAPAFCLAQD